MEHVGVFLSVLVLTFLTDIIVYRSTLVGIWESVNEMHNLCKIMHFILKWICKPQHHSAVQELVAHTLAVKRTFACNEQPI